MLEAGVFEKASVFMKKKRQKQLALFPSPSSWLLCGFDWYQGIHRVVMMSITETQS